LELLLDTICNTFGAVLFIALLLIIMLQMTSDTDSTSTESSQVSEQELRALDLREEEVRGELETVREAWAELMAQASRYAAPDLAAKLESLKRRRESVQERLRQRLELLGQIGERQEHINEITAEMGELDRLISEAEAQKEQTRTELNEARAERTTTTELSHLRKSFKSPIAIIVRYSRVYVWHKHDSNGVPLGLNTDDFVILDESSDQIEATPMPYAGVALDENLESQESLRAWPQRFPPQKYHMDIAVWSDSFAAFRFLKQALVAQGYEYRLVLLSPGGSITDRGGAGDVQ
jgi:hypothetical protein